MAKHAAGNQRKISAYPETSYGVSGSTGFVIPRTDITINGSKTPVASNLINSHKQKDPSSQGGQKVDISFNGELGSGRYAPFVSSLLGSPFNGLASTTNLVSATFTVSTNTLSFAFTSSTLVPGEGTAIAVGDIVQIVDVAGGSASHTTSLFTVTAISSTTATLVATRSPAVAFVAVATGRNMSFVKSVIASNVLSLTGATATSGLFNGGPIKQLTIAYASKTGSFAPVIGDVVRILDSTTPSTNEGINFFVASIQASGYVLIPLKIDAVLGNVGTARNMSIVLEGSKVSIPDSGHTDTSFTIEDWSSDISAGHIYYGNKVKDIKVNFPNEDTKSTVSVSFTGQRYEEITTTKLATATDKYSGVSTHSTSHGLLIIDGKAYPITSADLSISIALEPSKDIFNSGGYVTSINSGLYDVSGSLKCAYADNQLFTMASAFVPVSVTLVSMLENTPNSAFISFSMPSVILSIPTKSDGDTTVSLSIPFNAFRSSSKSTIYIQDSSI